jgi:hypothetical protein
MGGLGFCAGLAASAGISTFYSISASGVDLDTPGDMKLRAAHSGFCARLYSLASNEYLLAPLIAHRRERLARYVASTAGGVLRKLIAIVRSTSSVVEALGHWHFP